MKVMFEKDVNVYWKDRQAMELLALLVWNRSYEEQSI